MLKRRWTVERTAEVVESFRERLVPQPFGSVDGRVDLRSLQLPEGLTISGLEVAECDLSGAHLRSAWLEKCKFFGVRFDGADLSSISDHGNYFENCTFSRTKLREACLGYEGSKYLRCQFVGASFARAVFIRPEFDESTFVDCKLKGADFNASSFAECKFSGRLEDVWFRGGYGHPMDAREFGVARRNEMRSVSFADAELRDVTFSNGCDLGSVIVPARGNYRLYRAWGRRLSALQAKAQGWAPNDAQEAEVFVRSHAVHAAEQEWYLLNCDDLVREFGSDLAQQLARVLDE